MNIDRLVHNYARENDMTWKQAMEFLSKRESLQVGLEIMGINIFDHGNKGNPLPRKVVKSIVDELGAYLKRHRYNVPKRFEDGVQQYLGYVFCEDEIEQRKPKVSVS